MNKKLFLFSLTLVFSFQQIDGYSRNGSGQESIYPTSQLDSLQKSLSITTDSLEVADLCWAIYYHMTYDLLIKSPVDGNYLMRALRIYESRERWKDAGRINNSLGGIYYNRKQFNVARKYWHLARKQYRRSNHLEGEAITLSNISETYAYESTEFAQNQLKAYLDSTINLAKKLDNSALLIWPYINLGKWHIKKQDLLSAEKYTNLSISIAKRENDIRSLQSGVYQLGIIKKHQGNLKQAIHLIEESLTYNGIRKTSPDHLDALAVLSELYGDLGNFKKAYTYLTDYKFYKDTLFYDQHAKALLDLEIAYETEKKEQEIEKKNSDIALLAQKNKVKNQQIVFGSIGFLLIFGFVLLTRSRSHIETQKILQEKFSQELIQAQENERTRVSKELHDSVGQQLTLIKKKAQRERLKEYTELTNTALEEVRSISRGLYPCALKQLGLSESIGQLLNEMDEEVDMFFSVSIESIDDILDEEESLNFYRFIQESVVNVIKHAKAKTLEVSISKTGRMIEVLIKDNGCGFDRLKAIKSNSLGLKTLSERIRILKGVFSIQSQINKGTTIVAKIPVAYDE